MLRPVTLIYLATPKSRSGSEVVGRLPVMSRVRGSIPTPGISPLFMCDGIGDRTQMHPGVGIVIFQEPQFWVGIKETPTEH